MEKQLSDKGIEFKNELKKHNLTFTEFLLLKDVFFNKLTLEDIKIIAKEEFKNE